MATEVWLGHDARQALYEDICPYCDVWLEYGIRFQDEEGRYGGRMICPGCHIQFTWIDSPFECTIEDLKE